MERPASFRRTANALRLCRAAPGRATRAPRLRTVLVLRAAVRSAREILQREKVELVIGTGDTHPLASASRRTGSGRPSLSMSSNVEPGISNRLVGRFASLVCVGFEETVRRFRVPALVTGTPAGRIVRAEPEAGALAFCRARRHRRFSGAEPERPGHLRRAAPPRSQLYRSARGGLRRYQCHREAYRKAGIDAQIDGFVEDMVPVYREATMAIASAGARTLAELSASALPSLLVPLPGAANGHQYANAKAFAARGATDSDAWSWAGPGTHGGTVERNSPQPR